MLINIVNEQRDPKHRAGRNAVWKQTAEITRAGEGCTSTHKQINLPFWYVYVICSQSCWHKLDPDWDPVGSSGICELLGLCRRLHNWTRRCFKMEAFSSASESSDHHQQNLKKDCFHSLVWYEGCTKWPVFHLCVQSGELVLTPGRKNVSAAPREAEDRYRWMERMDGGLSAATAPSMAFWAPWFHKVLLCWWTPFDDFLLRVYPPILHYPAQLSFQVCTCRQMRWFGLPGICF